MFPVALKTPDITSAQVLATAVAVVTELANAALISGHLAQLLVGLAGILIPFAWILADAVIRHGRSRLLVAGAPVAAPDYRHNADGSWTRTRDGVTGTFGPVGFHPSTGNAAQ